MDIEKVADHMARFIRKRRTELGLSLEDVAERCDKAKSHIWELEKGRTSNPTLQTSLKLCDALQCSLNDLIGIDVSQPNFSNEELSLIAAHRQIFNSR